MKLIDTLEDDMRDKLLEMMTELKAQECNMPENSKKEAKPC